MLQFSRVIQAVDSHTAGEPTRIVRIGLRPVDLARIAPGQFFRQFAEGLRHRGRRDHLDVVRQLRSQLLRGAGGIEHDEARALDRLAGGEREHRDLQQQRDPLLRLADDQQMTAAAAGEDRFGRALDRVRVAEPRAGLGRAGGRRRLQQFG